MLQDVDYLGSTEVSYLGTQNVSSALVKGVAAALDKNKEIESKGVKVKLSSHESIVVDGLWTRFVKLFNPMSLGKLYVYMALATLKNFYYSPWPLSMTVI